MLKDPRAQLLAGRRGNTTTNQNLKQYNQGNTNLELNDEQFNEAFTTWLRETRKHITGASNPKDLLLLV